MLEKFIPVFLILVVGFGISIYKYKKAKDHEDDDFTNHGFI